MSVDPYVAADLVPVHGEVGQDSLTALGVNLSLASRSGPVHVRSGGGSFDDGLAIAELIRKDGRPVFADYAGSSAALILAAGRRRILASNGFVLLHSAWTFAGGRPDRLRELAEYLDLVNQAQIEALARYTGQSVEMVAGWLEAETIMDPEEALAFGLVDEIGPSGPPLRKITPPSNLEADLEHQLQGAMRPERTAEQVLTMSRALAMIDGQAFRNLVATPRPPSWPMTPGTASAIAATARWTDMALMRHRDRDVALPSSPAPARWQCPHCSETNYHPPAGPDDQPAPCPHCKQPAATQPKPERKNQ